MPVAKRPARRLALGGAVNGAAPFPDSRAKTSTAPPHGAQSRAAPSLDCAQSRAVPRATSPPPVSAAAASASPPAAAAAAPATPANPARGRAQACTAPPAIAPPPVSAAAAASSAPSPAARAAAAPLPPLAVLRRALGAHAAGRQHDAQLLTAAAPSPEQAAADAAPPVPPRAKPSPWTAFPLRAEGTQPPAPRPALKPVSQAPGSIPEMKAEVLRRRNETAPPPPDALNRAAAAYNTAALLRGVPFHALHAHAVATHDGPVWDDVGAAFDAYDGRVQLKYVLNGVTIPLKPAAAFVPVPNRGKFTKAYSEHEPHVNHTMAKDAADGRVRLFSAAHPHLRREGFHDNPLSHVRKASEPMGAGRPTCNASKGPTLEHFIGSLNDATDQAQLRELIGSATVHTIKDLSCAIEREAHLSPDGSVVLACVDIRACFKHARLDAQSSLLLGSAILDTLAPPGSEPIAWACPVGLNFGWTGSPACAARFTDAAQWLVHSAASLRWYEEGLLQVGRAGTPLGPPSERFVCCWVDDSSVVAPDAATCLERLCSLCRAYELVLRPHASPWARGPPPGRKAGAAVPCTEFARTVIADNKTVWPNSQIDYSGWSACGASRSISLSAKGWLALVAVVEIDLAVHYTDYATLEHGVHVLRHYSAVCPVAEAFTSSLWHALKKSRRGAKRIDLSSCLTDIRWWGSLLREALTDSTIFSWYTDRIAGLVAPNVAIESDASGFGGGLTFSGALNAAFKFEFTGAERAASAGDAPTLYEINILEAAAFIGGLAAAAPFIVGATVDCALDNTAAISWCRKMRTHKPAAALLLRWLGLVLLKFDIVLSFHHLAGILNIDADRLSRWSSPEARADYGARHPSPSSPHRVSAIRSLPTSARALVWQALAVMPPSHVFDAAVRRSL